RGEVLMPALVSVVGNLAEVTVIESNPRCIALEIAEPDHVFSEEERSRVPSVFTVLRAITSLFHTENDSNLGLYGAFGYDLAFQFDPVELKLDRPASQRDLVLYLPDEI